jgi:hypothetical protein
MDVRSELDTESLSRGARALGYWNICPRAMRRLARVLLLLRRSHGQAARHVLSPVKTGEHAHVS